MLKFDTGTILKNTNGREYIVIHDCGDYTLLKDKDQFMFIVAWNVNYYPANSDTIVWDAGHYFRPNDNDMTVLDAKDDCVKRAFTCLFEKHEG